ncbi:GNAT family N-acetyltransferase [Shewanella sedimentimangrovi]|uniref:GNAT family N-acetyltransferase n=1 Tax=Shewanella sedimentimangrovi TaxID=2814293 RepID=A0ABX7R0J2_9GAMM|nr:GNAT family N-acetyltransferase [Shewanella sedimentimangrovi]QSX37009.1 GNAT family N-acetyltransferase [Shewanella sedimentimangrovi]
MHTRLLSATDAHAMADYFRRNQAHFAPWEPLRPEGFHSLANWQSRIRDIQAEGSQCAWLVLADERHILGHCALSNIVGGPFQACFMGYGIDRQLQGRGQARQMCETALQYAFGTLKLHRVMANYMPANVRSGALLERLGFEREGFARSYLQINGRWEDHILTAKIAPCD